MRLARRQRRPTTEQVRVGDLSGDGKDDFFVGDANGDGMTDTILIAQREGKVYVSLAQ